MTGWDDTTPAAVNIRRYQEAVEVAMLQADKKGMYDAYYELLCLAGKGRKVPDLLGEEAEAWLAAEAVEP